MKNKMNKTGDVVTGYLVMLGYMKRDQNKRKFGIINALKTFPIRMLKKTKPKQSTKKSDQQL